MALDELQASVAKASVSEKLVVHAGPGSGKTLTLIERLKFLMLSGVQAGEVLVVSFSVAAKEELEKRIKHTDENEDIRFIHPRTLDSLATQIVTETSGSCSGSFLSRIKQAKEIVRMSNPNPPTAIDGRKHILIDEAQDIVGSRAELLLAILSRLLDTAGFTVFADVAQSIYDFQIEEGAEDEGGMGSLQMINLVESLGARSIRLENYYRSEVPAIKDICRIPWVLLLENEQRVEAFNDLLARLKALPSIGALNPEIRIQELTGKTKALLCRTNYQVIATAAALRKKNPSTKFTISRSERIPKRPHWIAKLLFGLDARTLLEESSLKNRYAAIGSCELTLPELLHYLKRQLRLKKRDGLYVHHLIAALNDEQSFKEITASDGGGLIVGTIHGSKGREYDSVAIYFDYTEDRVRDMFSYDKASQACTLFVGMSRPRKQLVRYVAGSRRADISRFDHMCMIRSFTSFGGRRAIEKGVRGHGVSTIVNFQVGVPGDVAAPSFVRKPLDVVRKEQLEVLPKVTPGEAVILRLQDDNLYYIYLDWYTLPLGSMTHEFTSAIKRSLDGVQKYYSGKLPVELRGGWVRGLCSAAATPGDTNGIPREILECGVWGCVELEGWASLVWN
jgi:DNA helicase-2/ATP-dependent DNA helicase PcrA